MKCPFCEKADFGSFSAKVDKYGASIHSAGGYYRYPKDEQFKFCPECARPLTKPEPLSLEQLRGMDGEPVWVVLDYGYWDIADGVADNFAMFKLKCDCPEDFQLSDYGITWLAYTTKTEQEG